MGQTFNDNQIVKRLEEHLSYQQILREPLPFKIPTAFATMYDDVQMSDIEEFVIQHFYDNS